MLRFTAEMPHEDRSAQITLASLAALHGSDKVPNCSVYEQYLRGIRCNEVYLLEIGVGGYDDPMAGGGSLRMWRDYFPNGLIFGIDLHDKTPHEEDRIRIFKGSQDDVGFLRSSVDEMGRLDLVIDDGSHISSHVIKSFETLFPLLSGGGLYIVEDVGTSYWKECGGSDNFNAPGTSMNYLKGIADGMNYFAFRHPYTPVYADTHTKFVHFYTNFVILQKA
jgi:hypothetical protein